MSVFLSYHIVISTILADSVRFYFCCYPLSAEQSDNQLSISGVLFMLSYIDIAA